MGKKSQYFVQTPYGAADKFGGPVTNSAQHTNTRILGIKKPSSIGLAQLKSIISRRIAEGKEGSYTYSLYKAGVPRCAKKFGEESVELVIASIGGSREEFVAESADMLFHFLVLLEAKSISLEDIFSELQKRTGQSGVSEKSKRPPHLQLAGEIA